MTLSARRPPERAPWSEPELAPSEPSRTGAQITSPATQDARQNAIVPNRRADHVARDGKRAPERDRKARARTRSSRTGARITSPATQNARQNAGWGVPERGAVAEAG